MTLEQITEFFKWMSIINIAIMVGSSIVVMLIKDSMCKMHGKMFGIKPENIAVIAYGYLGLCKAMVITFNLVPYIALKIIAP